METCTESQLNPGDVDHVHSTRERATLDYAAYHPKSAALRDDPYPFYQYLREHEPLKFIPDLNGFAVSRNADVRALLLDHAQFSSDPLIEIAFGEGNPVPGAQYLIASDPPVQTRLRTFVNKAFFQTRAGFAARASD
ncbi:MAG: cytochrome P450 [Gammaproteobacteria bacterium]